MQNQHKYLIYTRKSTDDANNQKNSIDFQIGACLRFAQERGLPLAQDAVEGFYEAGIIREKHSAYKTSGLLVEEDGSVQYKIERPKFQRLITSLVKKEYLGVICLCWDRISRNEHDGIIIKNLIAEGVAVHFVQATYEQTSSGALHMDIDGMFAGHYSRVVSEKVRHAKEKLSQEGKCTYPSPIGYLDAGSAKKEFDPERAPLVRRLFELYATGEWGLVQLAKWANENGLTSKPVRRDRTEAEILAGIENTTEKVSTPLTHKSVEYILRNPFYIGKIRHRKQYIDGIHPILIDSATFYRVQDILKSKNKSVYYVDKRFFIYRGLIHCTCGRVYTPYEKKSRTYYNAKCLKHCQSSDRNLTERAIDAAIEELLGQIHFTDTELAEIESRAKVGLKRISTKRNKELEDLHSQRKRILGDFDYLKANKITLLRHNTMSPKEFTEEHGRLEAELAEVDAKVQAYSQSESEMLKYVITFSELVKMAKEYYKHALDSEKREIAKQVFSELVFFEGKLHHFEAKDGFQALFARHQAKEKHPAYAECFSGGPDGNRTRDLLRDREAC